MQYAHAVLLAKGPKGGNFVATIGIDEASKPGSLHEEIDGAGAQFAGIVKMVRFIYALAEGSMIGGSKPPGANAGN